MDQPQISKQNSWQRHEKNVIEAIILALSILRSQEGLVKLQEELNSEEKRPIEDRINRALYFCLNKANHQLCRLKRGVKSGVTPEPRNQPNPDIPFAEQEFKRPDFMWGYFDPLETDEWKGNRNYTIECKRLGKKSASHWEFNKKYVENGIRRFISEEHSYGKSESSGAMIGYIENMEFDDILQEVNAEIAITLRSVPQLSKPLDGWKEQATSRLEHEFKRPFPISPFHLWHFWIDLRGCYSNNLPVKNQKRTTKKKSL